MQTLLMSDATLTVEIKNKNLVELIDFTDSLYSLASEYKKFLVETEGFKLTNESKLYIKEVRTGSIITILQDISPLVIPFIEHTNSIIQFTKFIGKATNWLLGKSEEKPKLDNVDLKNIHSILNPIAKDNSSQIMFTGEVNINNNISVSYSLDSIESNAIQNKISRLLIENKTAESNIYNKALFYWDTTKYNEKSTSVDRGIIESIYGKPLKVIFDKEDLKNKMLDIETNPYHLGFIIDVEVQTVQNIPAVYKILELHETVEK